MAGPITWRNVIGPSLADAGRPMEAAQRSFDGAFNTLNNVLTQRQQAATLAQTKQKDDNTQTFLDSVAQYRSPEELQAAQQSGELDQLRLSFGDQIDRAAVRGAPDAQLATLRTNTKQAAEFGDFTLNREQRGLRDDISTRLYQGDTDGAADMLSQNPQLLNRAEMQKSITDYKRTLVQQGRDDSRFEWDETNQGWKVKQSQASINASNASATDAGLRTQLTRRQIDQSVRDENAQKLLSEAYLESRDNTQLPGGLPNERAMTDAAGRLVEGADPVTAARVLQEAIKSDQSRVDAWRTAEDTNGFVGSSPLNATSVISALAPEIAKIEVGSKGEVAASINQKIREGHVIRKGTRLPDGTVVESDLKLPITLNVARAALAESDTTFGLDRGGDAINIIEKYMSRPDVIRDILNRENAEKLKASLQSNPTIPGQAPRR